MRRITAMTGAAQGWTLEIEPSQRARIGVGKCPAGVAVGSLYSIVLARSPDGREVRNYVLAHDHGELLVTWNDDIVQGLAHALNVQVRAAK